jgi:hypothetical protein
MAKHIIKDGKLFYSVADAAKLLGVTKSKVQELMAADLLEWGQTKLNGRLIVDVKSIERCKLYAQNTTLLETLNKNKTS